MNAPWAEQNFSAAASLPDRNTVISFDFFET
jgi:hypothetical protein